MDQTPIMDLLRELPFPVAQPAAVAFGLLDEPAQGRLWHLVFAAEQALRLASIPGLAQLLSMPDDGLSRRNIEAARIIASRFRELQTPTFHGWVATFFDVAKHATEEKLGEAPWLPLDDARKEIKGFAAPALEGFGDRMRPTEPLRPYDALRLLRNRLAHGAAPDEAQAQAIVDYYLPFLEAILRSVRVLARTTWKVLLPAETQVNRVLLLRGWEPCEARELEVDDDWFPVLSRLPHVAFSLDEGEIRHVEFLCSMRPSPLGLYHGWFVSRRDATARQRQLVRVVYLGMGTGDSDQDMTDNAAMERLARLGVPDAPRMMEVSLSTVARPATYHAHNVLASLRESTYEPALFVSRPELDEAALSFLRAKNQPILLVAGAPGSGKTAWLAHLVEQHLALDAPLIVMFMRCSGIGVDEPTLLQRMLRLMGLAPDTFVDFDSLLARLEPEQEQARTSLVLAFDALNDASLPEAVMGELLELGRAARDRSWLRVIATIRTDMLDVLLRKEYGNEVSRWHDALDLFHDPNRTPEARRSILLSTAVPILNVPPLGDDQARIVHGRLQSRGGCTTKFDDLPSATQALLKAPLMARLFHEVFRGIPAQAVSTELDVYRAYVRETLNSYGAELGTSVQQVLDRMLSAGVMGLSPADEHEIRRKWAQGLSAAEARARLAPVESLVVAGLLRREESGKESTVVFAAEAVLEYLVYQRWCAESPEFSEARLGAVVSIAEAEGWMPLATRACSFVFEQWLEEGRVDRWAGSLTAYDAHPGIWASALAAWMRMSAHEANRVSKPQDSRLLGALAQLLERLPSEALPELASRIGNSIRGELNEIQRAALQAIAESSARAGSRDAALLAGLIEFELAFALEKAGEAKTADEAYEKALLYLEQYGEAGRGSTDPERAVLAARALAAIGRIRLPPPEELEHLDDALDSACESARDAFYDLIDFPGKLEIESALSADLLFLETVLSDAAAVDPDCYAWRYAAILSTSLDLRLVAKPANLKSDERLVHPLLRPYRERREAKHGDPAMATDALRQAFERAEKHACTAPDAAWVALNLMACLQARDNIGHAPDPLLSSCLLRLLLVRSDQSGEELAQALAWCLASLGEIPSDDREREVRWKSIQGADEAVARIASAEPVAQYSNVDAGFDNIDWIMIYLEDKATPQLVLRYVEAIEAVWASVLKEVRTLPDPQRANLAEALAAVDAGLLGSACLELNHGDLWCRAEASRLAKAAILFYGRLWLFCNHTSSDKGPLYSKFKVLDSDDIAWITNPSLLLDASCESVESSVDDSFYDVDYELTRSIDFQRRLAFLASGEWLEAAAAIVAGCSFLPRERIAALELLLPDLIHCRPERVAELGSWLADIEDIWQMPDGLDGYLPLFRVARAFDREFASESWWQSWEGLVLDSVQFAPDWCELPPREERAVFAASCLDASGLTDRISAGCVSGSEAALSLEFLRALGQRGRLAAFVFQRALADAWLARADPSVAEYEVVRSMLKEVTAAIAALDTE